MLPTPKHVVEFPPTRVPKCADGAAPRPGCEVALALAHTEIRLSLAQEAAGIGAWEVDTATGAMSWSPGQFALYGVDPAVGAPAYRQWLAMVEKEDRAAILQAERDMLRCQTQSLRLEFRVRRPSDGAVRRLAGFGRLVPGEPGAAPRIVGVDYDVTELRETEQHLAHTTAMLDMAREALKIGLWEYDVAENAATWSAEMFALYGLDPAVQPPTYRQWLDMVAPADRGMMHQAQKDLLLKNADELRKEFRIARHPDGATRNIASLGRMMATPNRPPRMVGVSFDVTDMRETEAALLRSTGMFRATFEQAAVGMAQVNFDGSVIMANDRLCELLGYSQEEMLGLSFRDVTHPDDLPNSEAVLKGFTGADVTTYRTEKRYLRKNRTVVWVNLTVSLLRDDSGKPHHCLAVVEDVTKRKLAELALQESEARARRLFDGAPLPNYLVDPVTTEIVDSNEAATQMLGYTRDELRGMRLADIDPTYDGVVAVPARLAQSDQPVQFETQHQTSSGAMRDVVIAVVPLQAPGRRLAHGTVIDISDRKRAEADLKRRAEHDNLTGLFSRNWFFTTLEATLGGRAPTGARSGALILIDIDYFKQVNDTMGHDAGDALLIAIAARLRTKCRAGDIAARLGGDEFALLIPGIRDERAIGLRMADILAVMAQPVDVDGRQVHVSVSMGATSYKRDGAGPRDLLKNADLALYEAKRSGRSCWRFFRQEQAESLERHVRMADALRHAIGAGDIQIALQPKRLIGGGHAGFEALARWYDGTAWVPPNEFVPVAEATGLIRPLGRVVLELSLARLKSLRKKHRNPGRVAVNVSGADLLDSDFVAHTQAALRRHRLTPADLELEVTETVLLGRTADRVDCVLRELRATGIAIALDDFGTGFASLAHISRLAVDGLKIDKSFVAGIGRDSRDELIARTIVALAQGLHMDCVAEGVETQEQLQFLAEAGCNAAQGYLISKPLLTLAEAEAYLDSA